MGDKVETAKLVEAFNQGFDALVDMIGGMEGRILALEHRPPVTPEERASVQEAVVKKQYVPRPGTAIATILVAMMERGGSWNTGRVLDVLHESGHYPDSERPESVASGILQTLMANGYLSRRARGAYHVTDLCR